MIGGNLIADIEVKTTKRDSIGSRSDVWEKVQELRGFLDLASGDSHYTTYDAKIQESTHIFICDYQDINEKIRQDNSRMRINGKLYDVKLIDNPMELNQQLEIYLKLYV